MLEQSQIRLILADILESPEFKESPRYRVLLRFLVEESIAGRSPKETTIGTQVFGKDPSFNSKEDATVRVYINNLRKKLEHYYRTSGKTSSYKLVIPIGHYKVDFVPSEETPGQKTTKSRALQLVILSASLVVVFLLGAAFGTLLKCRPGIFRRSARDRLFSFV